MSNKSVDLLKFEYQKDDIYVSISFIIYLFYETIDIIVHFTKVYKYIQMKASSVHLQIIDLLF